MNFTYIEDARILSLALDLAEKMCSMLAEPLPPKHIFIAGIGESGLKIAKNIYTAARNDPAFSNIKVSFRAIDKDDDTQNKFLWTIPSEPATCHELTQSPELSNVRETAVLLVDGVVRTGKTLLSAYKALVAHLAPRNGDAQDNGVSVWSYAIAVNPNSSIIPTWFGTLYSPSNYVVLSRESGTPNVTMLEITKKVALGEQPTPPFYPPVVLRVPEVTDGEFQVQFPSSMNRYKSVDRYFDHETKSRTVFVVEIFNDPVGYISFHVKRNTLWLDYILIGDAQLKKLKLRGVSAGAGLLRFVASYARSVGCTKIGAWAISNKLETFYLRNGFQRASADPITFSDGDHREEYELIIMPLDMR